MYHNFDFGDVLASSVKAAWQVEDVLPSALDHARPQLNGDDHRVSTLPDFAGEEARHIHLFRLFHQRFTEAFGTPCEAIGPAEAVAAEAALSPPPATA
jgi:hypothetical protein